jgi:hypothetical protein
MRVRDANPACPLFLLALATSTWTRYTRFTLSMNKIKMKIKVIYVRLALAMLQTLSIYTFIPYCNFATSGLSDMKVKSFRFRVNGRGTMSSMKMAISATSRRKTWRAVWSAVVSL